MWLLLLFMAANLLAEELDLSSVRLLEAKLPDHTQMGTPQEKNPLKPREENRYQHPHEVISFEQIGQSGTELGSVRSGVPLTRIEDGKIFTLQKSLYLRYYRLEDEFGFKYLLSKDGTSSFKINSEYVVPIREELALYRPPSKYTPAPPNRLRTLYDRKLRVSPGATLYVGYVMGDFMKDLFNDPKAGSGLTTQYGLHLATRWDLPLKVGAVVHYEKSTYGLTGGGQINYNSFSFGPQIKSKDFQFAELPYRLQLQLRIGPFAKLDAETELGRADFKFNSTDMLASVEHPRKNQLGEFVFSLFFQSQWLNFKDQPEIVSIRASNKTNTALGLSIAQVFE